jgi:hypothetical protein
VLESSRVEARCLAERNCNVSVASLARLVRAARQRRNTARCVAAQHGSTRPGVRSRLSRMICRPPPIDRRGPLNRRGERRVAVPGLHHVITLVPSADRSLPARAPARLGQVEAPGSRRDEAPPGRGPFQKLMKLATHRFYRQAQHRTVENSYYRRLEVARARAEAAELQTHPPMPRSPRCCSTRTLPEVIVNG